MIDIFTHAGTCSVQLINHGELFYKLSTSINAMQYCIQYEYAFTSATFFIMSIAGALSSLNAPPSNGHYL